MPPTQFATSLEAPAPQTQAAAEAHALYQQADTAPPAPPATPNVPAPHEVTPLPAPEAAILAPETPTAPIGGGFNIGGSPTLPTNGAAEQIANVNPGALPEAQKAPAEPDRANLEAQRFTVPENPAPNDQKPLAPLNPIDTSLRPADPANPSTIARVEDGVLKVDSPPTVLPPYTQGPVQAQAPTAEHGGSSARVETNVAPQGLIEKISAMSPAEQAYMDDQATLMAKFKASMANPH